MTARRALISGASIAGLSTAFWLHRTGWDVTVIERAEAFRDGGQNVDVRGVARDVLARMGLEEAVRRLTTTEEGTAFVDARGRPLARFAVGEDAQGPTAELEILRGDLAGLLRDQGADIRYGRQITGTTEHGTDVEVTFRSGAQERYDLLVIAEGVRSATRDLVFGPAVERRELGLNIVYGTIPRTADDDRWWRWYTATGGRAVHLRPDNRGTTRAMIAYTSRDDLSALDRAPMMTELRRVFAGAGWETERVLDAFATSGDVYPDYLTQIVMPSWSTGHTCVVGDAAWCVTPLGGGGASLALAGGYVLAACLSQDRATAFERYEAWMRPLVTNVQKLPPGVPRLAYPRSAAAQRVFQTAVRVAGTGPFRKLIGKLGHVAGTRQALPEITPSELGRR